MSESSLLKIQADGDIALSDYVDAGEVRTDRSSSVQNDHKTVAGMVAGTTMYVYGASLSNLPGYLITAGKEYHTIVSTALGIPLTSYAVGGTRSNHSAWSAISGTEPAGNLATNFPAKAGSAWAKRGAIIVLDTMGNDVAGPGGWGTATTTKFINGTQYSLRSLIVATLKDTRVEQTTATLAGMAASAFALPGFSGGTVAYGTTPSTTRATFAAVNPPTTGPYAGTVFFNNVLIGDGVGATAAVEVRVNGVLVQTWTPGGWTTYSGGPGYVPGVIKVTGVPQNASIEFRHAGAAGEVMYVDALTIPRAVPNPTFMLETHYGMLGDGSVFNSTTLAQYNINKDAVSAAHKAVAAEFPHVMWVENQIPSSRADLLLADGLHYTEAGHAIRAYAVRFAISQYMINNAPVGGLTS